MLQEKETSQVSYSLCHIETELLRYLFQSLLEASSMALHKDKR